MTAEYPMFFITSSNDCTIRYWDYDTGEGLAILKMADPVFTVCVSQLHNMMFVGGWDKMIRCIDLEDSTVAKSFIAA